LTHYTKQIGPGVFKGEQNMENLNFSDKNPRGSSDYRKAGAWFLIATCFLVVFIAIQLFRSGSTAPRRGGENLTTTGVQPKTELSRQGRSTDLLSNPDSPRTAEQIVAAKVAQFGGDRRKLAHAMARHHNVPVPDEVERFFDAVEAGNWEQLNSIFDSLSARLKQLPRSREFDASWPAVMETYGVADIAHRWPAQKLLDYGNAVLDSLRPGMVYVGGTDPGRFIPTLLNETSSGEQHIVLTQNALADNLYLEYLSFQYGERFKTLTNEDSTRAFSDYVTDAERRLRHDQEFPNEPKQLVPGEDVTLSDGRVQVGGQIAVMGVNEKLLATLMRKNPELSFALEESFPLKSTYAEATPLGPIMELRIRDEEQTLTPERAAQSVEYWRGTAQKLLADPEAAGSFETVASWSKMAAAHGNLLANQNHPVAAEEAFRLAAKIFPGSPEAALGLAEILTRTGRTAEARQLVTKFTQDHPKVAWILDAAASTLPER
jgi:hypothetical protein